MTGFIIEPAEQSALAACFAVVPELAAPDAVMFVARDNDGTLAGVGGMVWQSWGSPPGFPVWVRVLPDRRKAGIGRALLGRIAAEARGELDSLWAIKPLESDGDAAKFALAFGAHCERRHLYFEGDARNFLAYSEPVIAALVQRGRIPAAAAVLPLEQGPLEEVGHLVSAELRMAPPMIAGMLAASAAGDPATAPIDRARSCVLMVEGTLAGALLSRRLAGRNASYVVCNVIAPAWRGGWANALLLDQFTRTTIAAGCFRIALDCGEDVRDTIGLTRRSGAETTRIEGQYRYAIA